MLEMTTSDSVLCLEDVQRYDRKCYLIAEQSGLLKHNSIFLNDFNLWHFLRGKFFLNQSLICKIVRC